MADRLKGDCIRCGQRNRALGRELCAQCEIELLEAELQKYRQAEADILNGAIILEFERQPKNKDGWTISTRLLKAICQNADVDHADYLPSWKAIETVLLALEKHFCDSSLKAALAKEGGGK